MCSKPLWRIRLVPRWGTYGIPVADRGDIGTIGQEISRPSCRHKVDVHTIPVDLARAQRNFRLETPLRRRCLRQIGIAKPNPSPPPFRLHLPAVLAVRQQPRALAQQNRRRIEDTDLCCGLGRAGGNDEQEG
eukprot:3937900-Rhodomonas_salina.1